MSSRSLEKATAWTFLSMGNVWSPAWMTSSRCSFKSTNALRMDGVSRGEVVRFTSNPSLSLPVTINRSSSAPLCVAQKKHSSALAPMRRMTCSTTKPSQDAPTFGWPSRSLTVLRLRSVCKSPLSATYTLVALTCRFEMFSCQGDNCRMTRAEARISR